MATKDTSVRKYWPILAALIGCAGWGLASNFVWNNTPLPSTKIQSTPIPAGTNPATVFQASDANSIMQACYDLRTVIDTNSVSVLNYGADPTGATDSAVAFSNAFNAAAALSADGGVVTVPAGTYKMLSGPQIQNISNVTVIGSGPGTELLFSGVDWGILVENASHITLEKLQFAGTFSEGIYLVNSSFVLVRDCVFAGTTPSSGSAGIPGGIIMDGMTDSWIEDNALSGNGYLLDAGEDAGAVAGVGFDIGVVDSSSPASRCSRITVSGNNCTSTKVNANIGMYNTDHSTIAGNFCTGAVLNVDLGSGGYGIMNYTIIGAGDGGTYGENVISNNHVKGTLGTGIYVQKNPNSTITGNFVENVATAETPGTLLVAGIAANYGNTSITGNVVLNSGQDGIAIQAPYGSVTGNTIISPAGMGVNIYSSNITVTGNNIQAAGQAGIGNGDYYDSTNNPTSAIVVTGNTIGSSAMAGIGLSTLSNSVISNNTVYQAHEDGIDILNGSFNRVSNNSVLDSDQNSSLAGIGISGSHCSVNDNTSINVSGATQQFGIQEQIQTDAGVGDYNDFYNNNVSVNSDAGVYVRGAHTRQANNQLLPNQSLPSVIYTTAAPTTGTWRQGDQAWNTTSDAGTTMWTCTSAGTPGTWVSVP